MTEQYLQTREDLETAEVFHTPGIHTSNPFASYHPYHVAHAPTPTYPEEQKLVDWTHQSTAQSHYAPKTASTTVVALPNNILYNVLVVVGGMIVLGGIGSAVVGGPF